MAEPAEVVRVTIDMSTFILDEVVFLTIIWLLVTPWTALYASKNIKIARTAALQIGLGVPLLVWAAYSLVGAIRALAGLIFLW